MIQKWFSKEVCVLFPTYVGAKGSCILPGVISFVAYLTVLSVDGTTAGIHRAFGFASELDVFGRVRCIAV